MRDYSDVLAQLNAKIWNYSELKFHEERSVKAHTALLEREGFRVKRGLAF